MSENSAERNVSIAPVVRKQGGNAVQSALNYDKDEANARRQFIQTTFKTISVRSSQVSRPVWTS